ncbi:MAG TPA: DoxX family protein [Anaerolineae bacterium]
MMNHNFSKWFDRLDQQIVRWLARYSLPFLRFGMGIVFLWFGALKFFPSLSPATELAVRTIDVLTFGLIPGSISLILLATLESVIGLGFLTGRYMRLTLVLLVFQMAGALTPLALFPGESFIHFPYAPTLEGQYIIKNLVLIGAGLVIGSTVRGGQIVADPDELRQPRSRVSTQQIRVQRS